MVSILYHIMLFLTGIFAGVLGGLLGVGGGVIMLPILTFAFNFPSPIASSTSLMTMIFTGISGTIGHLRLNNIDKSTVKIIALFGALGAGIGSLFFMYFVNYSSAFDLSLGIIFLYIALLMLYEGTLKKNFPDRTVDKIPGSSFLKGIIGFSIGFIAGILGVGGGFLLVPAFIYILNAPVKLAVGTSLPTVLCIATVSSALKLYQGFVELMTVFIMGTGSIIGAQIGARMIKRVPNWTLKLIFGLVYSYVSLEFIIRALRL